MSLDVHIKSARYGRTQVLDNINFQTVGGTLTAVIGRNGSGKSTLISCLASLIPFKGEIKADGKDLRQMDIRVRAQKVSLMTQNLARPHVTVRELVAFGRNPYHTLLQGESGEDTMRIDLAIDDAEMKDLASRYVDTLSGGEVRRAYFGAILAQDAPTALFDEATAFMDADYERLFLRMVRSLAEDGGKNVVAVMHDLAAAVRYADNILVLDHGKQLYFGKTEDLLKTDLIEKTFGVKRYTAEGRVFFEAQG